MVKKKKGFKNTMNYVLSAVGALLIGLSHYLTHKIAGASEVFEAAGVMPAGMVTTLIAFIVILMILVFSGK